ncbi:MAG: glycoside hydrolase family 32 protein [Planctomycetes bacterium]|nr:glycoside hydrolase family 32 protein [Planctomycetota bacterium]
MTEATMPTSDYQEALRPRFHYTSRRNWLNDPNGLVYFQGEYHLFYQYYAKGCTWGPNSWGHAVSTDLVHWRQLEDALHPDERFGWIWSGSAVVDHGNTSGLGIGGEPPLIAVYTAGGKTPTTPCVQCIAFSTDRGRTWTKHAGNPVIPQVEGENRDPKVIWHAPSRRWVMALYLDRNDFTLFTSPDLKTWTRGGDVRLPGTSECPDLFELPVADSGERLWVFWGGDGFYRLGSFDGERFTPTSGSLIAEHGPNGYAAQTWSDTPDGRRLQISWMRGGRYPGMPFNQQMSVPVELTLRRFPEGVRLCRVPVRELEVLRTGAQRWAATALRPGAPLVADDRGGLFDLIAAIAPGEADAIVMRINGCELRYDAVRQTARFQNHTLALPLCEGELRMRLVVDRTSVELFAADGRICASFCYLPEACEDALSISAQGGAATVRALVVHGMHASVG